MISELGKFLRKLRIDHSELLFDMAEKLGVSPSFLSAVENGKKRMPSKWNVAIPDIYVFSSQMKKAFTDAVAASEEEIAIDFHGVGMPQRRLGIALAREIKKLSPEKTAQLQMMLFETKDNESVKGAAATDE